MGQLQDVTPVQQTNVSGTGAVNIIPGAGNNQFSDLVSLIITTPNAAAATLTISDGNKTVMVLNYPNAAAAPSAPFVFTPDCPIEQSGAGNAAWTLTASVNASGFNVTAQFRNR